VTLALPMILGSIDIEIRRLLHRVYLVVFMSHNKVSDYVAGHSTASTVFIGFTESSTCSFNNGMIVENRT